MAAAATASGCGLAVMGLSFGGCYYQTEIRPDQLPRLNGAHVEQVGSRSGFTGSRYTSEPVYEVSVQHVLAPDGRTVEIVGEFDATISTTNGGKPETFSHPVMSEIQDQVLHVRGANRGLTQIPMSEVQAVSVSQYNAPLSTLAIALGSLGAGLLIGLVVISAIE